MCTSRTRSSISFITLVTVLVVVFYIVYALDRQSLVRDSYSDTCKVVVHDIRKNDLCSLYAIEQCTYGSYEYFVGSAHCADIDALRTLHPLSTSIVRYHFARENTRYYTQEEARAMIQRWSHLSTTILVYALVVFLMSVIVLHYVIFCRRD